MSDQLESLVANARRQLDEQTVRIVRLHFDPELGAPFWLKQAKTSPEGGSPTATRDGVSAIGRARSLT